MTGLCRCADGKRHTERSTVVQFSPKRANGLAVSGCLLVLLLFLQQFFPGVCAATEAGAPETRLYVFKSDMEYPPFEYVENNRLTGFNVELLETIAQIMSLNITFDWGVWSQIREELEAGQIDGLTGMFLSEERQRLADFSIAHSTVAHALFVHADSGLASLEAVWDKRIVVQEGDIMHDYLLSSDFPGTLLTEPTQAGALRRLASGDCDGALLQRFHGLYLAYELGLDSLVALEPDIAPEQYCFAVAKGNAWLLNQLNEGLRILKATGQYDEIRKRWLGAYEPPSSEGFPLYFKAALAIVAAVLFVIVIWLFLMRREVRRRTADLQQSEQRYRSLVDKLPDGITVLRDNEILFANRAAKLLFTGNGKAVIEGTSVLPYLHPEDRPAGLVHLSALPDIDAPLSDVRIVRPGSHEIRHAETAGLMIDYHDGPATLIMLRDITERKLAEDAVRRERNTVRAIMETSPVGIVMIDDSGTIVFANQQAERIFRLQRAQICQRTYDDPRWGLTNVEGGPFDVEKLPFNQVMKAGKMVRDVRCALNHSDGGRTIISTGGAPLYDAIGQLAGAVLTIEDITAQVEETRVRERHWHRIQRQQAAIIHISQDYTLTQGNFKEAARHITEHAVEAIETDSASIWLLRVNSSRLRCAAAYDKEEKDWSARDDIPVHTITNYLLALETGRYIDASDAQNDPRTFELCPAYLRPGDIGALLDVPIRMGGRLVGVLCIEHKGAARKWLSDEIQFAVEVAEQAGQAYAAEERRLAEEERHTFEAKLQHTQKLESLGILAGGIAHDFNNLLMAIIGNAELALMDISHANPARKSVLEIETVSRRAADLCRQMLAYSGKGRFVIEPISLNDVISEIGHMLDVSIPKNVVLRYDLEEDLPAVEADASQMRQVLMNLVINASEAIGEKDGLITVSTGKVYCDQQYFDRTHIHEDLVAGNYVGIEVADTGEGMDKDTAARIFDPFFTTKFTGRGLGLSAVQGIVRGHRGALKLYSEPGKGTTFKVLLPASDKAAINYEAAKEADENWRGSGQVLLVDDEEVLLTVTSKMLSRLGFEVLTATNGIEALELYRAHQEDIRCVILDLTMPNMNGEECFRELRCMSEEVRVLLSSGFNEQDATQRFVGKGLAGFIQKPYRFNTLAAKLHEILGD